MKIIIKLSLISLFLVLASFSIGQEKSKAPKKEYTVIVNRENPLKQLSQEDLAQIYLGKKTLWDCGILTRR